jgi:stage IV sporulation protein FB
MVFIGISFLTGTFLELSVILAIVLVHELGHYIAARSFKWRIRRIMLWVFGGVMDTDEHGNRPIWQEVIVTVAGPIQHLFIYLIIFFTAQTEWLSPYILETILYYNTAILVFNLLPIWPLDGGKLLLLFLSMKFPYKKAYNNTILFSLIGSGLFVCFQFFPFTLSSFLIMIFLFMENRKEWKHRHYVFMRFLLNRYEGITQVKKVQPIYVSGKDKLMDVFSLFKRDKKHSIYIQYNENSRLSVDETECLRSYFYDKQLNTPVGEVFHGSS